jgi:cytochrome c peroxidase
MSLAILSLTLVRAEGAAAAGEELLTPLPSMVAAPEDKPTTPEKVALGKQLFFDPRLSGDNTVSCASCHVPEKAFADGLDRARGHVENPRARNTPSLLNVGFYSGYFWDGRAKTLEEQALFPIQDANEMNQDLDQLVKEIRDLPGYVAQFQQTFATGVTREGIAEALAAFQRTLITEPSPFDRYLMGQTDALSQEAKRGLELFVGDAGCVRCHSGPLLSDGDYYRIGVSSSDEGRAAVTGKPEDHGKFRTPSLRNVAGTAPYMHNGSMRTLNEVVEFYLRGVASSRSVQMPLDVEPLLGLSYSDVTSLTSFLKSLTGEVPEVEPPRLP